MVLVSALLSALLATGAWWMLRDAPALSAAEPRPQLAGESVFAANLSAAAIPRPTDVVQPPAVTEEPQQRVASEAPPPLDFETRYRSWTLAQPREAEQRLAKELQAATAARLEELFEQFPLLLSQGAYGAHVARSGKLSELGEGMAHAASLKPMGSFAGSCRFVKVDEGLTQGQFLGFDPSEEAATAPLFAENSWVSARIQALAQQD